MTKAIPIDHTAFRRMSPEDQLRALRGQQFEREFLIERAGIDEKARTAWMSIASEEPYERWWGVEILDISPGAIIADRLKSGAALLVNHDAGDQVGVVERFEITRDRRLRVLARFGRSARAEEVFQDVLDGIRRNTSVGYVIHELILEKQEQETSTYRVTRWEPYEGSLVAVSADFTVGIGRQFNLPGEFTMPEKPNEQHQTRSEKIHDNTDAVRISNLYQAGEDFASFGGREGARQMIATPGATVEDLRKHLAAQLRAKNPTLTHTAEPADLPPFGTLARGNMPHAKLRVFTGEAGVERAHAFGQFLLAQMPGRQDAVRWLREHQIEQRYINSSVGSEGAFVVPDQISSEMIKNMDTHGVFRREARVWPMGSDLLSVPARTGGVTARFVAADTETTPSDPTFGNVNLSTKEVMAITHISRATMDDSVINLGDHVAFEITEAFAKLEDDCGFVGTGAAGYGGMQGIVPKLAAGSKSTAAAAHDTAAEIDVTDLANLMALLPQYAQPGAKWYMSLAMYGAILQRLLLTAGGNTVRTIEAGSSANPAFAGFPVVLSPVLPSDTTHDFTAEIILLFGNLQRASAFGDRQQISLMVDPYTLAGKAQIRILGYERFDIVNHGMGTATVAGPVVALVGGA